ncbi:hypothetical protein LCGC14_1272640 [marine sediment metagenome]|uniref:Uncharacterized protein n=1 Tax=marine sediment metagenome TaxID=412755 RepID=A0A0F9LIS1_9ZZZZ
MEDDKNTEDQKERLGLLLKLQKLSQLAVREFMGVNSENDDPRVKFLARLQMAMNLLTTQVAVLITISMELEGEKQERGQLILEELEKQVEVMESDLAVTGWDLNNNPLLDLPRWEEITKSWPK